MLRRIGTHLARYLSKPKEIMHISHHSLFAIRDFDISPYFEIIKHTLKQGFDFHDIKLNKPMRNESKKELRSDCE